MAPKGYISFHLVTTTDPVICHNQINNSIHKSRFERNTFAESLRAILEKITGCLTVDRPSSPGVRQLSVGEVRVSVRGERGVLGVRGEGRVSQALYPLGGGVGMATPERWQQPSASDIQASRSFSLSQSERGYTHADKFRGNVRVIFSEYCHHINSVLCVSEGLVNVSFLYQTNTHHVLGAGPQQ